MTNDWNELIKSHTTSFYPLTALEASLRHEKVAELLASRVTDGAHVLDFGCGGGMLARTLDTQFPRKISYTGYDPAPAGVALAKQGTYRMRTEFSTQLIDKQYDAAAVCFVLCTMPKIQSTISTISRVLRPGASILLCEPHPDGMGREFTAYRPEKPESFADGAPYLTHLVGMPTFTDFWHPKEAYRAALTNAGFSGIEFHEYLAPSKHPDWKDELIQAPYLHVCARKA